MPTTKTADMHALFECYDGNGHYFQKKVILNAQGNSSMAFVKKNFAADFCEDEWLGNETTKITIGNWVKQDAFHFKAFYTDYFRGIGEVGYKLFDDIIADRPSYQERAGLTDYDSKARCYPGGFPCVVYLNGNFYGIFAWQLKKHRDNMSQKKSVATNIHLDGVLDNTTLFRGTVDWTQFEIRNPKTLYCTDTEETEVQKEYKKVSDTEKAEVLASGEYTVTTTKPSDLITEQIAEIYGDNPPTYLQYKKNENIFKLNVIPAGTTYVKYDGDHPKELVDETMGYYDANNSGHVLSNEVKQTIIRLSGYHNELQTLKNSGASKEEMRAAIEERFDVAGIIDYSVFSLVTANIDGWRKNWQWFTWDGYKWFISPYDLDSTFGNNWSGEIVMPPYWSWTSTYKMALSSGPAYWVKSYFWNDIKERYEYLRSNGVLTSSHIMEYVYDWYNRVGTDSYNDEWAKWPESGCVQDLVCNANWSTTDDWTGYNTIADYDASTTYYAGDKCRAGHRIWTALDETQGVRPYASIGYTDNASRVQMWIAGRLDLEDEYMSFTAPLQETYDLFVSSVGEATVCVPFTFDIPTGIKLYTITGVDENNQLIREAVTTPVANKPYLVVGTPGTYTISGTYEEGDPMADDYMANGLLWGTYSTIHVPQGGYVLQANNNGGASFALVTKSNYITLGANKAYLELPPLGHAKASVLGNTETTAIDGIILSESNTEIESIYNASGIPTKNMNSGLNIVRYKNGETKKVFNK